MNSPDDIFAALSASERSAVERQIAFNLYPPQHLFFSPHEQGEELFVLRSGQVRLYKLSPEGRALTLVLLNPPALFGEMALAESGNYDSFAETMNESVVGTIGRETLRAILAQHPSAAIALMEMMSRRLRTLEEKLADIAFKSVPARLATLLLSLAGESAPARAVRYTHQQIAEMIGSYRETVTKALGDMREGGLIRFEDETIILNDLAALRRIAGR